MARVRRRSVHFELTNSNRAFVRRIFSEAECHTRAESQIASRYRDTPIAIIDGQDGVRNVVTLIQTSISYDWVIDESGELYSIPGRYSRDRFTRYMRMYLYDQP